ncbi:MAG: ATP synthase F1 subunit epsilon [Alphaproteobacteria bacterium]|nr:ATP synthase F1 subunit epsilon [Alphaproteobacteria bacterium]MBP9776991.1 ATP synthase F1 subunit epsilon [Alphaproteobacteria bacterium]
MATLPFILVSPEKVLFDQEVSMVVIPGAEGDIGILPQHAPLLTLLRPGVITIYEEEKILVRIFIDGGFSEVTSERCVALVTEGVPLESMDKSSLEIEINNLLEDLADSKTPEARKQTDQNLEISRAKLMELIAHQKID